METIIGDYIGTTRGIHSPIPFSAPDRLGSACILLPPTSLFSMYRVLQSLEFYRVRV